MLIFKRVRRALVFVRVCVQREVGGDDDDARVREKFFFSTTRRSAYLDSFGCAVSLVLN